MIEEQVEQRVLLNQCTNRVFGLLDALKCNPRGMAPVQIKLTFSVQPAGCLCKVCVEGRLLWGRVSPPLWLHASGRRARVGRLAVDLMVLL